MKPLDVKDSDGKTIGRLGKENKRENIYDIA